MNLNEQAACLPSDYRTIPLTNGYIAIVDAGDYEWLSRWKWCAHKSGRTHYAIRGERLKGRPSPRTIAMHRLILGLSDPATEGEHRDGDGLNNRRNNLRVATHPQNCKNQRKRVTNTSGFVGVHWHARLRKYRARITVNYQRISVGCFDSAEEAARARDAKATELHGEFARLNFPK